MKQNIRYFLFLFFSTFSRNIVDVFSLVFLYEKGYTIRELFLYLALYYFFSIFVNIVSIWVGNRYGYKKVLLFSSISLGGSFYYLTMMKGGMGSLLFLSLLLSISSYTYHSSRHYLGVATVSDKRGVSFSLIFSYLPIIFAAYIGSFLMEYFSLRVMVIVVILIALISNIPLLSWNLDVKREKFSYFSLSKSKIVFFVLEQFKVIFLLLEPLYLYLFINSELEYLGVFQFFIGIASLGFTYYLGKKRNGGKLFKKLFWIIGVVLILKLNIQSEDWLLGIGFLEGMCFKLFETISLENFYSFKDRERINSYLWICEVIFCFSSSIICGVFYVIGDLRLVLYICIVGICLCGWLKTKNRLSDFN